MESLTAGAIEQNGVAERFPNGGHLDRPRSVQAEENAARLSAADRNVLRRSCYEGRTTAQVAEDLHIADDTVKSTLHHTVRGLQHALQEMELPNRSTNRPS